MSISKHKCLELGINSGFHNYLGECWHNSMIMIFLFTDIKNDNIQKILFNTESKLFDDKFPKRLYDFMLPLNFELSETDHYVKICMEYLFNISFRISNNFSETKIPDLKRQNSQSCSLESIKVLYEIINNNSIDKIKYDNEGHGSTNPIYELQILNIFNYIFFNNSDNEFINVRVINNTNFIEINKLLGKDIIGIGISLDEKGDLGHFVNLFKCANNYYFYDDNGHKSLINGETYIDYDWKNILNRLIDSGSFDKLFSDILELYDDKYISKYYIDYIYIYYIDDFKNKNEYLNKINHQLLYYMNYNNTRLIEYINDYDIDIINKDHLGYNVLLYASRHNNLDIISILLNKQSDIESKNNKGNNALTIASSEGYLEIVELLLNKHADIESKNNYGENALISSRYLHIVNFLLDKGIDIESKDNEDNNALLHASMDGDLDIVKLLLDRQADIESKNDEGNNALLLASSTGHFDIVKLLLNKGANIESRNNNEENALLLASSCLEENALQIIKLLIGKGLSISSKDISNYTPLMNAVLFNNSCVEFLLQRCSNKEKVCLNIQDINGRTALMHAVLEDNIDIVKLILQYNPDITLKDNNRKKAINMTTNPEIINLLKYHKYKNKYLTLKKQFD